MRRAMLCQTGLIGALAWMIVATSAVAADPLPPGARSARERQPTKNNAEAPGLGTISDPKPATRAAQPTAKASGVYLGRSDGWALGAGGSLHTGRLARELVRQALLIAARDELRIRTQDAWLDDPAPADASLLVIDVVASPGSPSLIEFVAGRGADQEVLGALEFGASPSPTDYRDWASRMETLSRTRFVELLKTAGLSASPAKHGKPKLEGINDSLHEMTLTAQFAAVRSLHGQLATAGESTSRLAGLARGYANLGVLTEYFWHPMHEVFKARALLYAERLVAYDQWSPIALAHRAYAYALVGLPGAALDDLSLARAALEKVSTVQSDKARSSAQAQTNSAQTSKARGKTAAAALPAWANLLDAFCRYDQPGIQTQQKSLKSLAAVLRVIAAEQSGVQQLIDQAVEQAATDAPDCYRIRDGLTQHVSEASDEGWTSPNAGPARGAHTFATTLAPRLAGLDDLPEPVRSLVGSSRAQQADNPKRAKGGNAAAEPAPAELSPAERGAILLALEQTPMGSGSAAAAADEMPWALLGRMLEEVAFYQAWLELRPDLGQRKDASSDRLLPGVPQHRYRGFLEMARQDPTIHRRGYRQLLLHRDVEMLEPWHKPLFRHINGLKFIDPDGLIAVVERRTNPLARELVFQGNDPRLLLRLSPYCPVARAAMASAAWPEVAERAAEWEQSSAAYPNVLSAIGAQWTAAGKFDDAQRVLDTAFRLQPSADIAAKRAELAGRRGQAEERRVILGEMLELPDVRDADHIAAELARHAMHVGDWTAAEKFAAKAADQQSILGKLVASEVAEAMQQWETAEASLKQVTEEQTELPFYPDWLEWLAFCHRTGQGDGAAAHQATAPLLARHAAWQKIAPPDHKQPLVELTYFLLTGRPAQALEVCREEFTARPDPFFGLHAALLSDRLKDATARDEWLKKTSALRDAWKAAHADRPQAALFDLADLLTADRAKPGPGQLDAEVLAKLMATADEAETLDCSYFAADYLARHGDAKQAVALWEQCMIRLPIRATNRTLAGKALCDRAVTPKQYAPKLRSRSAAKPAQAALSADTTEQAERAR